MTALKTIGSHMRYNLPHFYVADPIKPKKQTPHWGVLMILDLRFQN
jgi:hypothetical protein